MHNFNKITESILHKEESLLTEQNLFLEAKAYCFVNGYNLSDSSLRSLAKDYIKIVNEGWLNTAAHVTADIAGLIPGWGEIIDIAHSIWYAIEGKNIMAALTIIGVIPGIGDLFKVGKYSKFGMAGVNKVLANPAAARALTKIHSTFPKISGWLTTKINKILTIPWVKRFLLKRIGTRRVGAVDIVQYASTTMGKFLDWMSQWLGKLVLKIPVLGKGKALVTKGIATNSVGRIAKGIGLGVTGGVVGRAAETGLQRSSEPETPYDKSLTTSARETIEGEDNVW